MKLKCPAVIDKQACWDPLSPWVKGRKSCSPLVIGMGWWWEEFCGSIGGGPCHPATNLTPRLRTLALEVAFRYFLLCPLPFPLVGFASSLLHVILVRLPISLSVPGKIM